MGFDFSSISAPGYVSYKKAIDTLYNQDEFDINMIITPGVLHRLHSNSNFNTKKYDLNKIL